MEFIGAPPQADFLLQLVAAVLPQLMRQRGVGLKLLEQVGHPPLFVPHRVPHDLRRVRGEDQPDVQFPQQLFHLRGGNVHPPQPLEHLSKGGWIGLVGEGRGEGIKGVPLGRVSTGIGSQAVEIAVFLDPLLKDVDELEIQRKGTGGRDGLRKVHGLNQLDDRLARAVAISPSHRNGVAELFESQQAFALLRWALTAQHRLPEVFNQVQPVLKKLPCAGSTTAHACSLLLGDRGGGLGHEVSTLRRTRHDHPKQASPVEIRSSSSIRWIPS